ncbi:YheU family protein [Exilibacterium tricleocarpae]|uniref:YheU family protein n=1 Tax=Exilibacterium tricleocarpae TaxID=2591008 RepID=A0A545SS31_9GAMM|nr:YheU family protein [Exilibacterium tricleocarpae]TQV67774.1 YheU family protein [Exilibacterium tricleocarpae]
MIVPHEQISPAALRGLIEEFITREGTDYGSEEMTLAAKVEQVASQLASGEVVVVYDAASETVNLMPRRDWEAGDWAQVTDS